MTTTPTNTPVADDPSMVSVGPSTMIGGGVSLAAFVAAIVAFIAGARDAATIGALATGVIILVTTLGGRYAQAVVQIVQAAKK